MQTLSLKLPSSLGEIIVFRQILPQMDKKFNISFVGMEMWKNSLHTSATDWPQKEIDWNNLLREIGNLLFNNEQFSFHEHGDYPFSGDCVSFITGNNLNFKKRERISHLLCQGKSLENKNEYLVLTTKVRNYSFNSFELHKRQFFNALNQQKYPIVLLGERVVEMRKEYLALQDKIFGLYDMAKSHLKGEVIDLTVPALGENVSSLKQIQQDCLIMNEAKSVITIGQGGNFCMAQASNAHCLPLIEGKDLFFPTINNWDDFLYCLNVDIVPIFNKIQLLKNKLEKRNA